MTVILATIDKKNKTVHMMGDSMVSRGEENHKSINKIWKSNDFVIACAGSFSMIQWIKRGLAFPSQKEIEDNDLTIDIDFMVNRLCPNLKELVKRNKSEFEKPSAEIIIAYKEDLYVITPYFNVFKEKESASVGSGSPEAKIIYETSNIQDVEKRLLQAIVYATKKVRSCGMPAYYINTSEKVFKEYEENGHWKYDEAEEQW